MPETTTSDPTPHTRTDSSFHPGPDRVPLLARRLLGGIALSALGNGLTWPFLLVYLHDVRGIGSVGIVAVLLWAGGLSLALTPRAGALVERAGPRAVLLSALVVTAASVAALAAVRRPVEAFVVAGFAAAGNAGLWPAQTALLGQLAPARARPRVFGAHLVLLNLGIGAGALVAGSLVDISRPRTFELLYLLDAASYLAYAGVLLAMPGVGRVALRGDDDLTPDGLGGRYSAAHGLLWQGCAVSGLALAGLLAGSASPLWIGATAGGCLLAGAVAAVLRAGLTHSGCSGRP